MSGLWSWIRESFLFHIANRDIVRTSLDKGENLEGGLKPDTQQRCSVLNEDTPTTSQSDYFIPSDLLRFYTSTRQIFEGECSMIHQTKDPSV